MPAPLPFTVSPSAEERLARVGTVPGSEPGICHACHYEARNKAWELTEQFDGEHFWVGFDPPDVWTSVRAGIRVTIAGREFWISPASLEMLRGRTLQLIQQDVGEGSYAGRIRDLLVAA